MAELTLVIGNKNYSSWSLRPWLLLKHVGVPFREVRVPLYTPATRAALLQYSPSGKVPALIDGDTQVWDSLAICEYVAERFPHAGAWPAEAGARATARSIAAEMHAGFSALRSEMPMSCSGRRSGVVPSPAARTDIDRIVALWSDCRQRFGGSEPWLFGRFTIADAMYAPVAIRFYTYGVSLPDVAARYVEHVLADPPMREWIEAGRSEAERLPQFESGTPVS